MNAVTEIQSKAFKTYTMSVISYEQCFDLEVKKALRNAPQQMTKKDVIKMNIRNSTKEVTMHSDDMAQIAMRNQLSSSLRK